MRPWIYTCEDRLGNIGLGILMVVVGGIWAWKVEDGCGVWAWDVEVALGNLDLGMLNLVCEYCLVFLRWLFEDSGLGMLMMNLRSVFGILRLFWESGFGNAKG